MLLSGRPAEGVPETPESFPSHQRSLAAHRQRVKASSCLVPFDLLGVIKRRHVLTEVMGGPGGTSVWFWGEIPRVDLPPPPTADVSWPIRDVTHRWSSTHLLQESAHVDDDHPEGFCYFSHKSTGYPKISHV